MSAERRLQVSSAIIVLLTGLAMIDAAQASGVAAFVIDVLTVVMFTWVIAGGRRARS